MRKKASVHEDTFESLLDRLGILREELISVERSLERMKVAQKATAKRSKIPRSNRPSANSKTPQTRLSRGAFCFGLSPE
jgi:hypothetical protein